MGRVVVGMSGGVDSFVAALMLQRQGWEVIGVHLELWGKSDLEEVAHICRELHIPLLVHNGEALFRQTVIQRFVEDYRGGRTPSPCCLCNSSVKWELLSRAATEVQASHIATGHYARTADIGGHRYIRRGADPVKDQSYFLWGIPQHTLQRALFPLGGYTKAEIKQWAAGNGYTRMAQRRESMGVCFLQGKDYRDFLRAHGDAADAPGDILDDRGAVIGRHDGLANYTVGQKRGMPLVDGRPTYAANIDTARNTLTALPKERLWTHTLLVEQVQSVTPADLQAPDLRVQIRGVGLNPQGYATTVPLPANRLQVHLTTPAWAVAPGQPVVFFRGDLVVGGGIACRQKDF